MKKVAIIWLILSVEIVQAQVLSDSSRSLSIEQYLTWIITNHPIAKQASLLTEVAQQELRMAKGSFDPKLEAVLESKEFLDKSYYNKADAYLSVPNRSPVTPKVGYERNTGELLNDIDRIPGGQQFLAGLNVALGRGLITDDRRTTLKQAGMLGTLAEAEQVKVINKLLLEATKQYWNWYYAYDAYELITRANVISKNIHDRVKINYQSGEASVMDTVQAYINWQSRIIEKEEAYLNLQNNLIDISNYLWDADKNPIQIQSETSPLPPTQFITITPNEGEHLIELAKTNHPELSKQQVKLKQYELDKRLALEYLKPKLDFNYYLLSQPGTVTVFDPLNDYKLGLEFSMPLFLRKERSKIALADIKIRNTTWELDYQQRNIINQTRTAINEVNTLGTLIIQQQNMVNGYEQLIEAELLNLDNGESDLFKVNVQQDKLIQSQLKLLKLKAEFAKQRYYVLWAAGVKNLQLG